MEGWLVATKLTLDKRAQKPNLVLNTESIMKIFGRTTDLTQACEYLLATGNLRSKTGKLRLSL